MKIVLIQPRPEHESYKHVKKAYITPPVQLEILASQLDLLPDKPEIKIFDSRITEEDRIIKEIKDAGVFGVSIWAETYLDALKWLEMAKTINPSIRTVAGGVYASQLGERIIRNNHFIDYVCFGRGEQTISSLVQGKSPESIPNLIYRKEGSVERGKLLESSLSKQPFFRLGSKKLFFTLDHTVDLDRYGFSLMEKEEYALGLPVTLTEGCLKAQERGKCKFCSVGGKVSTLPLEIAIDQLTFIKEKYGIKRILDTGDNFVLKQYMQDLIDMGIPRLGLVFSAEVDQEHTEGCLDLMAQLGMKYLFIGKESFDEELLKRINKTMGGSIDSLLTSMKSHGIRTTLSMMWGIPGETRQSAMKTYRELERLAGKYPDTIVTFRNRITIPYFGTPLFNLLAKREDIQRAYKIKTGRFLDVEDKFDYSLLIELLNKHFCDIPLKELVGFMYRADGLLGKAEGSNPHLWKEKLREKYGSVQ